MPKKYLKEQTTIRIELELLEKIDKKATLLDLSRSAFMNQCLIYALDRIENDKDDGLEP